MESLNLNYEISNPATPNYYEGQDMLENKREYQKKFRCPLREEEDGRYCNQKHDNLNEILNHFYKYHLVELVLAMTLRRI